MRVHIKFYGVLTAAAKTENLELDFEGPTSIRELVSRLVNTIARPEFDACLIDADTKDPRPNTLILVSGTEVGALNGTDTMLKDGDEIVFLPVAHGGSMTIAESVSSSVCHSKPASHTLYEPRQG